MEVDWKAKFAAVGDLHLGRSTPPNLIPNIGPVRTQLRQTIYGGAGASKSFDRFNEKVENMDLDFFIINGDMSAYRKYANERATDWILTELEVPLFLQVGDHDTDAIGEWEKVYNQPRNFYALRNNVLFLFVKSGNQIHGPSSLTPLEKAWIRYMLLYEHPDKLSFVITHPPIDTEEKSTEVTTGELTALKHVADNGSFWNEIIRNRRGYTINLFGHVHYEWENEKSFREDDNCARIALESNFLYAGDRESLHITQVKLYEDKIKVERYSLEDEEVVNTQIIKQNTKYNRKVTDEIGIPYWLMNEREISHWNHFTGNRKFEIVGIDRDSANVIPSFESIGEYPPRPWGYSTADYSEISYYPPAHFSGDGGTLSITVEDPPESFQINTDPNNQKTGSISKNALVLDPVEVPASSPSTRWEFSASVWNEESQNKPVELELQYLNVDYEYPVEPDLPIPRALANSEVKAVVNTVEKTVRNKLKELLSEKQLKLLSTDKETVEIGGSEALVSITAKTPPRTNVLRPVITFTQEGTYYIQNLTLSPEGTGDSTADVEITVDDRHVSFPDPIAHMSSKRVDAPVQSGRETIHMTAGGSEIGVFQIVYENPQYWYFGSSYSKDGQKCQKDAQHSPLTEDTVIRRVWE